MTGPMTAMTARPDPATLEAWRSLLVAHAHLTDRLDRELRDEVGMPLSWYDVLVTLHRAERRRLRMRDLAARVLITRSNCTRLVDRLSAAGLVDRLPDPDDRRGVVAVLTDEGLAVLRRAARVHLRGIEQHVGAHLDADDVAALRRVLGKLAPSIGDGPAARVGSRDRGRVV